MDIRETDRQDWQSLKAIRLQALSSSPSAFGVSHAVALQYSDERWKMLADAQRAPYFWLAFDAGVPVGMVGAAVDQRQRFTLIGMWVCPALRGGDIARLLVDQVKLRAMTLGFTRIILGVSPANRRAVSFYKRQGFSFIEEFERLDSHPEIELQGMAWQAPGGEPA